MEQEENIEELKRLFYTNSLTQYGKRKLINYYEQQIQRLKNNSIPKEKVKKIEKYCKSKSTFQTFGDEQLKRAIEIYVNRTKNDILNLLEE